MGRTKLRIGRGAALSSLLSLLVVALFSFVSLSEELGDVRITLQSTRYYKKWDLTRLVYKVKSPSTPDDQSWVLEVGACVTADVIDHGSTSSFAWVEDPFHGMRFEVTKKNHKFYLWLVGQWDVGPTGVAAILGGDWSDDDDDDDGEAAEPAPVVYTGTIDGPACEEASIAIDVTSGSSVAFPALDGAGAYASDGRTELRITSTTAGWSLGHALDVSLPPGASAETVADVFRVGYDLFEATAGETEIGVSYALEIADEDLAGLPYGAYAITVTFTVATD